MNTRRRPSMKSFDSEDNNIITDQEPEMKIVDQKEKNETENH